MHEFVTAMNGTGTTLIAMLLAVFIGIWLNDRGLGKLEKKVDDLTSCFDKLEIFITTEFMQVKIDQAVHEFRIAHLEKGGQ